MTMRRRKGIFGIAILGILGTGLYTLGQTQPDETRSEVPELTAFHEIIYPIWHTAFPEKDYRALRSYVPQIHEMAAKIYAASLPGILRDKETQWKNGLDELKKSVAAYDAAASGQDDPALLRAAEALHSRYEALVRTIRPVVKEVDDFHRALYVVYHTDTPEKNYDRIRVAAPDLVAKAEATTKALLPQRLAARDDAYRKASAELLEAAKALDGAAGAHDHEGMIAGVDKLHAKYQALEKIFD